MNVLQRAADIFKRRRDGAATRELGGLIEDYARGQAPLAAAVALVNRLAARLDVPFLRAQVYLRPHPGELRLRSHA